jgi:hypothetical protein
VDVKREIHRHGKGQAEDFQKVKWNQDRVRKVMQPFKEVAAKVPGNMRKPFTDAGGQKIGLPKDHPKKMWIDSYCGIKTKRPLNVIFGCYIKAPGDDPDLYIKNEGKNLVRRVYFALLSVGSIA